MTKNPDILLLRKKIDLIDQKVFSLLAKRFRVAKAIMKIKSEGKIAATDKKRENELICRAAKMNPGLDKKLIKSIYGPIFSYSKRLKKRQKPFPR